MTKFSDSISSFLKFELKEVNKIISQYCKGEAELTSEIANYLIESGGKRIRPILTILGAKATNYDCSKKQHYNLAAAVELIHSATLLHDDVVDRGKLRRGKETSNLIWGNKASILVGDYLFSTAFQLMVRSNSIEVLDLLSATSRIMADGEVKQLMNSTNINISWDKYLEIISQKTAILFAAASGVGPIIAESNLEVRKELYDYGLHLGIAFQIMDDILDYSSERKKLGKEIGDDFFEGKVTLPVILTYEKSNKEEKDRIEEIFKKNLIDEEKNIELFEEMLGYINKYNAIDLSLIKAKFYQEKAIKNLDILHNSQEKEMLIQIAKYCIQRDK